MIYILKIAIIGDATCGKSSVMSRYVYDAFSDRTEHTIGVDYGTRYVKLSGQEFKLQLWDLAGQEKYRSIARSYYRNVNGILLLFDLTNRESFEHLDYWYKELLQQYDLNNLYCAERPAIILVGNKMDLEEFRVVSDEDVRKFRQKHSVDGYMETSAKNGINIEVLFNLLVREVYDNIIKYGMMVGEEPSVQLISHGNSGDWYGNNCCGLSKLF